MKYLGLEKANDSKGKTLECASRAFKSTFHIISHSTKFEFSEVTTAQNDVIFVFKGPL